MPQDHQQENHLIDSAHPWEYLGRVTWRQLQGAVEQTGGRLWTNGSSSRHGINDRVPEGLLGSIGGSLRLLRPERLSLIVGPEEQADGGTRRRVRAKFQLGGEHYCFSVTDPTIERHHLAQEDGERAVSEALLCVSLSEPFYGFAYKLVASVITPWRAGR